MNIEELVPVIFKTIIESFKLDKAGILLQKGTFNYYQSEKLIGFKVKDLSLKTSNFLIQHLKKTRSLEINEELTLKIKDISSEEKASQLVHLKKKMRKMD